jgi:hypothetical protein
MPSGVGALTNSLSFLDLGGIHEEPTESNRNMFGQLGQQDQFLAASAGIKFEACLPPFYPVLVQIQGDRRCAIVMNSQDCQGGCSVVLVESKS